MKQPNRFSVQARRVSGFTLIEVLVALGIVAISIAAGFRAMASVTNSASRQTESLLAQLCAENELVRIRLSQRLPGIGESTAGCEQAGRVFQVTLNATTTPNPEFRRVQLQVAEGGQSIYRLSAAVTRY